MNRHPGFAVESGLLDILEGSHVSDPQRIWGSKKEALFLMDLMEIELKHPNRRLLGFLGAKGLRTGHVLVVSIFNNCLEDFNYYNLVVQRAS